jgi:hypothetical protein
MILLVLFFAMLKKNVIGENKDLLGLIINPLHDMN